MQLTAEGPVLPFGSNQHVDMLISTTLQVSLHRQDKGSALHRNLCAEIANLCAVGLDLGQVFKTKQETNISF